MPIYEPYFNPRPFGGLVKYIFEQGAVSIHDLLKKDVVADMQYELEGLEPEPQPETAGSVGVKQDFSLLPMPGIQSVTHDVCVSAEMLVNDMLHADGYKGEHLHFNSTRIQRYEAGSAGITPHRDFASDKLLVVLIPVMGEGRFCICKDREGSGARELRSAPGDLILMRGYGFLGAKMGPFHFLDSIASTRISIGLRYKEEAAG